MDTRHSSPARIVAPLALVVFALALLIILSTAGGSDHSASTSGPNGAEKRDLHLKGQPPARRGSRSTSRITSKVYVVKTGDTLAAISQRTGISIERLQTLNPRLDPQAMTSGQRIRLR
jgi:LysM repeat protein